MERNIFSDPKQLPTTADIVIIGGGVNGVAAAYYLTKKGMKDIVVLERDYLTAGSTGRCGAGFRQQWSTVGNIKMAMGSVKAFQNFEEEIGYDGEIFQGGYLILAFTDEEVERYQENVALQTSLGLDVQYLSPEEAKEVVPGLNTREILGATYCPTDGHANPFKVTYGYAQKAVEQGAKIYLRTEVAKINSENGKITAVETNHGTINTDLVINCAGGQSHQIGEMAGLDLPTQSERHQILITEPVRRYFDPMIIDFEHGLYLQQVEHGAFIMGQSDLDAPKSMDVNWRFMVEVTRKATHLVPALEDVSVVRVWAGYYNITPDHVPIIGEHPELSGFYNAIGFSGHGFMLAPMVGQVLSELIVDNRVECIDNFQDFSIKRFEDMEHISFEKNVV